MYSCCLIFKTIDFTNFIEDVSNSLVIPLSWIPFFRTYQAHNLNLKIDEIFHFNLGVLYYEKLSKKVVCGVIAANIDIFWIKAYFKNIRKMVGLRCLKEMFIYIVLGRPVLGNLKIVWVFWRLRLGFQMKFLVHKDTQEIILGGSLVPSCPEVLI